MTKSYAFVLDSDNKKLSPTPEPKAWYLIRKKRANLISLMPLTIKLTKSVSNEKIDDIIKIIKDKNN